jgi:hypothetical protein
VGYARVSTDEQGTDPQLDELRAAGCATILEEHASGADRDRPVLARLPVIRLPSAKYAPAATLPISKVFWSGWIRGFRLSG